MRIIAIAVLSVLLAAGFATAGVSKKAPATMEKVAPAKQTVSLTAAGLLDCTGAVEVTLDNVYTGDNTGLLSNVAGYPCNPWYEPGGEVVFHLFLAVPTMFTAAVQGDYCDVDLAILNQCDEGAGCIDVVDATYSTTEPLSGDIYLVVDGYDEGGCPFTLTLTEESLPEPTTFCDLAQVVTESGVFYGYPCGGENLVSSGSCSQYGAGGLEDYYSILMPAGSTLTATLTHVNDGVLWLLGSCTEPYSCLAYADDTYSPDPETITYVNTTAGNLQVYLVADSFQPNSCGAYDLEITLTPGGVPADDGTIGNLKWLFR
jgi:hypothetical protein